MSTRGNGFWIAVSLIALAAFFGQHFGYRSGYTEATQRMGDVVSSECQFVGGQMVCTGTLAAAVAAY